MRKYSALPCSGIEQEMPFLGSPLHPGGRRVNMEAKKNLDRGPCRVPHLGTSVLDHVPAAQLNFYLLLMIPRTKHDDKGFSLVLCVFSLKIAE